MHNEFLLRSLASSTKMISLSRCRGDRLMTLVMVRSSTDQASLWNTMITDVVGKLLIYRLSRHLRSKERLISFFFFYKVLNLL